MDERRFYLDRGDDGQWRQLVAGPGEPPHEAAADDPDLIVARAAGRLPGADALVRAEVDADGCPDDWHYHEDMGCPRCGATSLDAAWADAEAALPEGWAITLTPDFIEADQYNAEAKPRYPYGPPTDGVVHGLGSTPAAALRALAAKLRERAG